MDAAMDSNPALTEGLTRLATRTPDAARIYPSAIDTWLMVVLYLAPAGLTVFGGYLAVQGRTDETLTCWIVAAALSLINLLLTLPCRYTLTADSLNVRCGLFIRNLPLSSIRGAELSRSWRSGPALSLRRVRIVLDRGDCLVSPIHREAFIDDLMRAVAHHGANR